MGNFKAVYRILPALEKAMDLPGFDVQQIGHEALGVTQERWCRYMEMMADVGYITGVEIQWFITGETSVDARDIIGVCIDGGTGEAVETNRFTIHYGGTGTHVVPATPERSR